MPAELTVSDMAVSYVYVFNLFFLFAKPPNAALYLTLNLYQISHQKREELARAV